MDTGKSNRVTDRKAARQAAGQAGFTLAELAIVVFIISLFAVFALPRLPDLAGLKLEKNGRRMAHAITYLYSQASSHRLLLRFNVDFESGEYYVTTMNEDGEFKPVKFPLFSSGKLGDGVRVSKFTSLFSGTFSGETAYMHLMPEGFAEQAVIVLADRGGVILSLVIDPLTGRVTAHKGEKEIGQAGKAA